METSNSRNTIADVESYPTEQSSLLNHEESDEEEDNRDRQLMLSTVALSFAMLVQSYLLVSVFPYAGFLAMKLIPGLTEDTAGSYAGLVASSFMIGRTFSSFEWGKAADRYGRTFAIKASLLSSAVFSIMFGLAPSFSLALLIRLLLGLCNGLLGPIKTLVSELSGGVQSKETKVMAIVGGMWGYGLLFSPAISGFLSDPVKQYPESWLVDTMGPLLRSYPFLLPNLVGCAFCLIGYIMVDLFVEETLPMERRQTFGLHSLCPWFSSKNRAAMMHRAVTTWSERKRARYYDVEEGDDDTSTSSDDSTPASELVSLSLRSSEDITPPSESLSFSQRSSNEEVSLADRPDEKPATIQSLWARSATRQHLLVYWIYAFLVISVGELFPLFCMSKASGLGIEEKMIGTILSGAGVFYIAIQYVMLTRLVDRYGYYGTLRIGAFLSVPMVCLIPISLYTNKDARDGSLNVATMLVLCVVYAFVRAFSSVTFSVLTMTTNRTVPAHHRATMNGLSMLGGSLSKAVGPMFAGILFTTSVGHMRAPFGSVTAYGIVSLLGFGLFLLTTMLKGPDESKGTTGTNGGSGAQSKVQPMEIENGR